MDNESDALLGQQQSKSVAHDKEKSYICCLIPADWVLVEEASKPVNSSISTIILLLNNMIGSGILAQAYVFKLAGIGLATCEYIVFGVIIFWGVNLLIKSGIDRNIFEYGELAASIIGDFGEFVVNLATFVGSVGSLIAYVIIIGSLASDILSGLSTGSWWTNSITLSVLIVSICVTPLCLIRRFGHLAQISYASIGAVTSVMLVVVCFGVSQGKDDMSSSLNWASALGLFETMGTVIFAFGYINSVFHALTTMNPPDPKLFSSVCAMTTYLGVCMCYLTGLVGYYCFRSDTNSDILENFTGTVGDIFKIVIIVHLVLYIPGDFVIMRHSLFKLFDRNVVLISDGLYITSTVVMMIIVVAIANLIDYYSSSGLALTLELTGGVCGSTLHFILPGILTIKNLHNPFDYYSGVFLIVFGIFIAVSVIIVSFL